MRNISQEKLQLTLTKAELSTFPNRKHFKKYESLFTNNDPAEVVFQDRQEFEMAKYSHFPEVRRKFFLSFSGRQDNTQVVLELIKLRQSLANNVYKEPNYFVKQQKLQSISIKGDWTSKIKSMLQTIRPQAQKDLETITKLTGDRDIRYYDAAYLKDKVKGMLLARDPNNIQMLTCFTLQNVFKGLMILAADVFGQSIDLRTLILTFEGGENVKVDEYKGY